MKKSKKMSEGITLIALVVTIIVLLVLAGISIQMLTGNNGILNKAGQTKKRTNEESTKEQIQLEVSGSYGIDGKIDLNTLKTTLGKIGATVSGEDFPLTVTLNGLNYEVDNKGIVTKIPPTLIATLTNVKIVDSSGLEVAARSTNSLTTKLYIKFEVSLTEGQLESVTHNGKNVTVINGVYSQEVSENGDYRFTINGLIDGENVSDTKQVTVNQFALRAGIKVGDYIMYTPPTRTAYKLYGSVSGYGNNSDYQEIPQEYTTWRVLNINEDDGSIDIVAAVVESNKKIYFENALGWNNAVWALDNICKMLYEVPNSNSNKKIIARSIDIEDVTDHMIKNASGKVEKIENYISTVNENLSGGNIVSSSGNRKTYQYNTWYPLLYPKQANESDPYYSSATSEREIENKPSRLTVDFTSYNFAIAKTDFTDYNNVTAKSGIYNALFTSDTPYWLASRCVDCDVSRAFFCLRGLRSQNFFYSSLFTSYDRKSSKALYCICPIVTLGSEVQVTVSTDASEYHVSSPHTVVIPAN